MLVPITKHITTKDGNLEERVGDTGRGDRFLADSDLQRCWTVMENVYTYPISGTPRHPTGLKMSPSPQSQSTFQGHCDPSLPMAQGSVFPQWPRAGWHVLLSELIKGEVLSSVEVPAVQT